MILFIGHSEHVRCIAFSLVGGKLATGSDDKTVRLWDINTGKHLLTLTEHAHAVQSIAFSQDGKYILSGDMRNAIHLWNANIGELIRSFSDSRREDTFMGVVTSVAFSPDGKLIAHTSIKPNPHEKVIEVGSPELFDYPFSYIAELGRLNLSKKEAENLREYLLRGGFIMMDDFHGTAQWKRFYKQYKRIFPKRELKDIPMDHPIFHCFFKIDRLMQIPAPAAYRAGRTHEKDGFKVRCMGVFDDNGRLMMMINFNTDLGDAWQNAAELFYPKKFSNMAFKMGINAIVYTLTH